MNEKKFKRAVTNPAIDSYGFYLPIEGTTRIVPDGTLEDFVESNWLLKEKLSASDPFIIFNKGMQGNLHKIPCSNEQECREAWRQYGWDYDEIFTVSQNELRLYSIEAPLEPQPSWIVNT